MEKKTPIDEAIDLINAEKTKLRGEYIDSEIKGDHINMDVIANLNMGLTMALNHLQSLLPLERTTIEAAFDAGHKKGMFQDYSIEGSDYFTQTFKPLT